MLRDFTHEILETLANTGLSEHNQPFYTFSPSMALSLRQDFGSGNEPIWFKDGSMFVPSWCKDVSASIFSIVPWYYLYCIVSKAKLAPTKQLLNES